MATYYWVGGNGTWNNASTANWSASSGGAAGAGPPLSTDNVIFDANSGGGTASIAANAVANNVTLDTNNTTTAKLTASGFVATSSFILRQGTLDLNGFTMTCEVFTSNVATARSILFGTGSIIYITRTITVSWVVDLYNATTLITLTGSPLFVLTGNFGAAVTMGIRAPHMSLATNPVSFSVTAGSGTLDMAGSRYVGTLDFTGFNGTVTTSVVSQYIQGDFKASSGMTFTPSTNTLSFVQSGTSKITTAGKTFDFNLRFGSSDNTSSAIYEMQDALTTGAAKTITLDRGTLKLKASATTTAGTFATSSTESKFLRSTTPGTQATLSQASGTVNVTNTTITDINATGGATWQAYTTNNNVDGGNNLGWDFSSQVGKYMYSRRKNKRILP